MFDKQYTLKRIDDGTLDALSKSGFDIRKLVLSDIPADSLQEFLDPGEEYLCDPFLLPDIDAGVDRVLEAAENDELVAVFGDYDCDGICATAVMYDFMSSDLSVRTVRRIPERSEGYGLSCGIIDELYALGVTLIITVDCGISCAGEVAYAHTLGIDVVITDHHDVPENIPGAVAVIDPKREDSEYPNRNLCGCAVAYKFCLAVAYTVGIEGLGKYLPVVMTATIGDVMKLVGENRSLVQLGLRNIKNSCFFGFNALVNETVFRNDPDREITSKDVSYFLVPRINAPGRMGNAALALDLMLAPDVNTAEDRLREMGELNDRRKLLEEEIVKNYRANPGRYERNKRSDPILFVQGDGWPHGITGIIAARILDEMGKPVCVMSRDETFEDADVVKASVRSTDTVKSIVNVFSSCKELCLKFGGHTKALGFSAESRNIPAIIERCVAALNEKDSVMAVPCSEAIYIPSWAITVENAEKLSVLDPTGEGNQPPLFITDGILSVDTRLVGEKSNAIRFEIRLANGEYVNGINFKDLRFANMIKASRACGVVFNMSVNTFKGKKSLSINVVDVVEGNQEAYVLPGEESYPAAVERVSEMLAGAYRFTIPELRFYYRYFAGLGGEFDFAALYGGKLSGSRQSGGLQNGSMQSGSAFSGNFIPSWYKIKYALEIFCQSGYISKGDDGKYTFLPLKGTEKLSDSRVYSEIVNE
ncbi:MAG: single-stranded-DNA-specific exonuclease RecJ [Clostridia bacterium]|nr:single-stranded-DNA-specific exonuclease RecJ [Clostridia bacterium]